MSTFGVVVQVDDVIYVRSFVLRSKGNVIWAVPILWQDNRVEIRVVFVPYSIDDVDHLVPVRHGQRPSWRETRLDVYDEQRYLFVTSGHVTERSQ